MNEALRGIFFINVGIMFLADSSLQREVFALPRATVRFAVGVCASLCYLVLTPGSEPGGAAWVARQARSLRRLTQVPAETMEIYCKKSACDHSVRLIAV